MAAIPEDARTLGAWLAEQRDAAGMTQAELAQAAGVATRTIQRWEGGTHAPVDVIRVLTALGVRFEPAVPEDVQALNTSVAGLRGLLGGVEELIVRASAEAEAPGSAEMMRRLAALEEKVEQLPTAADLHQGLEALRKAIARAIPGTREGRPTKPARNAAQ